MSTLVDPLKAVAIEVVRKAAADWRAAVAFTNECYDRLAAVELPPEGDPARHRAAIVVNNWTNLSCVPMIRAESHLIACVLAMGDRGRGRDYDRADFRGQRPHALALDGVLYLVVPEPNDDILEGEPDPTGTRCVHLVTMPLDEMVTA